MKHLNCDQLLKCTEIFEWKSNLYLFFELMDGGAISGFISTHTNLSEVFCKWTLFQVALGLKAMHDKDILHRDIKSENVLCNKDGDIKICDLGFSCFLHEQDIYKASDKGTPGYAAPELFKGTFYSKEIDVWSFGCFAYELATGRPPFVSKVQTDRQGRLNLGALV